MFSTSPLPFPLVWAAVACLAAGALIAGAAGAGGHELGDDDMGGPCLFDGLEKRTFKFHDVSAEGRGNTIYNSASYVSSRFAAEGISPLGAEAIRRLGENASDTRFKEGCESDPAKSVAKWLFDEYEKDRHLEDVGRGIGGFLGIVASGTVFERTNLRQLDEDMTPAIDSGWALIAANYRGLMSARSDEPAKLVEDAVAMSIQPLGGQEMGFLFYRDETDGIRKPHIPDVNPHIGQLVNFPEPAEDDDDRGAFRGLGGNGGLGPKDLQPVFRSTEGVYAYVQEGDDRWERIRNIARGDVEFEIHNEDFVKNTDALEFWTVQHLFSEIGRVEGVGEGPALKEIGDVRFRFYCRVDVPLGESGSSPRDARDLIRGGAGEETAKLWSFSGVEATNLITGISAFQAAESLWDAWVLCQSLAALPITDVPSNPAEVGARLDKMTSDNAREKIADLLQVTAPSGNEALLSGHVYSDALLERARLPLPCGGVGLFENEADGHRFGIAGLCRYQIYTDKSTFLGVEVNPVEYGQLWVANTGMWLNRIAMEGMVWITRNIYQFGLADNAIGGMAAIFTPLNEWLTSPVEVRDRTVELVGQQQREGKDPVPITRVVPDPLFTETKRVASEQGVPRWVFWGLGIFLTFFVAFQLIRGKTAVAGKEILISIVAGTLLFWMVETELDNPGSWYRTVGGAATNAIRGITDITFGEGEGAADIGVWVYYEPPPNFYPDESDTDRMLRWTDANCDWLAAEGADFHCEHDAVREFPANVLALQGEAAEREKIRQKTAWLRWAREPSLWRRTDAMEAMRLWKFTAPRGGWPAGWPHVEGSHWPADSDFGDYADLAEWREETDEDNLLGLSNRRRVTETRSGRLAAELGEVLGADALNGLYNRVQWGDALEGEEWKYCRERAWAALVRGDRGDGGKNVRSFMEGDFTHSKQVWPPTDGGAVSYRNSGYIGNGKGATRSSADPCGDDPEQTVTPAALASFSSDMPIERTMGPWIAAIPTVTLFVALVMNAVPIFVAQFLLAVLFALMPVIALIAIMPGRARTGLFKWVGHILRAVLTILFGVVFVVLAVWILKAVYLLPGSGFWQDLLVGIAGAAAIWKLRGGMWRGATQVAARAATGLGKAVGSKSEVSFKGDKLGEKFVREKAAAVNQKRQDALRRYEAGRGRLSGGLAVASTAGGMAFSRFTPSGKARRAEAKRGRDAARNRSYAVGELRKEAAGWSDAEWKKAQQNDFEDLRADDRFRDAFVFKNGKWQIRGSDDAHKSVSAAQAFLRIKEGHQEMRENRRRTRRLRSGKAAFHEMAASYRGALATARQPGRDRFGASAFGDEQVVLSVSGKRGSDRQMSADEMREFIENQVRSEQRKAEQHAGEAKEAADKTQPQPGADSTSRPRPHPGGRLWRPGDEVREGEPRPPSRPGRARPASPPPPPPSPPPADNDGER